MFSHTKKFWTLWERERATGTSIECWYPPYSS